MRDRQFRLVMTDDERAMLDDLSKATHHPAAYVIRDLVRRAHKKLVASEKAMRRLDAEVRAIRAPKATG